MKITIVGSGNVAVVLAHLCNKQNHSIVQIIARDVESGQALANKYNASYINFSQHPIQKTDVVIVSIADSSYPEAIAKLSFNTALLVHTAASVSMSVLEKASKNIGVLYPLQSLRKEMVLQPLPVIPFLIEANTTENENLLLEFAQTLSQNVQVLNEDKRLRMHAAAIMVGNFTNYLYMVTEKFCEVENIDFKLLVPLIVETAQRIEHNSPKNVQTGPAFRKDIVTLDKHLRLLTSHPQLRTLYMRMTDGIMNG